MSKEIVAGNIFCRVNGPFLFGKGVPGHKHNFAHRTTATNGWGIVRAIELNGKAVEASDWWRIIEVPGVAASQFADLLSADPEFFHSKEFETYNPLPRKRVRDLDLDAIEAAAGIAKRQEAKRTVTLGMAALLARRRDRAEPENPNVFGINRPGRLG